MTDKSDKPTTYRRTPRSDLLGSAFATCVEQAVLYPIDVFAKTSMAKNKGSLQYTGGFQTVKRVYSGFGLALAKKIPMRSYKWTMQSQSRQWIEQYYGKSLEHYFPDNAKLVATTASAVATGFFEPFFINPIDVLVTRLQALGNTKETQLTWRNVKSLGFSGLYRGAVVTGALRNAPGCIGLFSGDHWARKRLGIEDTTSKREHPWRNLGAKWFGAFWSILLSQVGDVIKTNMQVHQMSFKQACRSLSVAQMMTLGLPYRLALSLKLAFGFFIADGCMDFSASLLGDPITDEPGDAGPRLGG